MINDLDIGWISGIIDGEGCFTFAVRQWNEYQLGIIPRFTVGMEDGGWEERFTNILDKLELNYLSYTVKTKHRCVQLSNKNAIKLAQFILPYLSVKIAPAKLISDTTMTGRRKVTKSGDVRYASFEIFDYLANLVEQIHKLNGNTNKKIKWSYDRIMYFFWSMPDTVKLTQWRTQEDKNKHLNTDKYAISLEECDRMKNYYHNIIVGKKPDE